MDNWYYHAGGENRIGPLDEAQMRDAMAAGRLRRDTLVWREGMSEWLPLHTQAALLAMLPDGAASPPPLPAQRPTAAPISPSSPADAFAAAAMQRQGGSGNHSGIGSPPKRGLSGCMIALLVGLALLVPMIAILAAIALPAYNDYTIRSKVQLALAAGSTLERSVDDYIAEHGACPVSAQMAGPRRDTVAASPHLQSVDTGPDPDGDCANTYVLGGINANLDGLRLIRWRGPDPAMPQWHCYNNGDASQQRWLPPQCRNEP